MKLERVLALVLIAICGPVYMSHTITVMRPNDPTGYMYAGMRIAEGGLPSHKDHNNLLVGPYFSLNAFKVVIGEDESTLYLQHPPGLPLLIGVARLLVPSPIAVFYVVAWLAVLGAASTFALGTLLFNERVGLLAAVLLAFSPIYLRFGTETWSDIPAMTFILLSLTTMIISLKRRSLGLGLLSGFLMGYAFLIRYPSVLTLPPLALYVYLEYRGEFLSSKGGRGFVTALALMVVVILVFNRIYYGSFLITSYYPKGDGMPWRPYAIEYLFGDSPMGGGGLAASLDTLRAGFPYCWPLVLLGLVLAKSGTSVLLAGMCIVYVGFYSVHLKPPLGINSRLLITVFPPCAMMIGVTLDRITDRLLRGNRRLLKLGVGLTLVLLAGVPSVPAALAGLRQRNVSAARRVDWTVRFAEGTGANAVFICSQYDDLVRIYGNRSALNPTRVAVADSSGEGYDETQFEPALIAAVDALLSNEIPVYFIDDRVPEHMRFMHVHEALSSHYELSIYRDKNPTIYQISGDRLRTPQHSVSCGPCVSRNSGGALRQAS